MQKITTARLFKMVPIGCPETSVTIKLRCVTSQKSYEVKLKFTLYMGQTYKRKDVTTVNANRGSRGIAPLILNFGARWR